MAGRGRGRGVKRMKTRQAAQREREHAPALALPPAPAPAPAAKRLRANTSRDNAELDVNIIDFEQIIRAAEPKCCHVVTTWSNTWHRQIMAMTMLFIYVQTVNTPMCFSE